MFVFADKTDIPIALHFARDLYNKEVPPEEMLAFRTLPALTIPRPDYTVSSPIGYGEVVYSNDFTCLGVGQGYINDAGKIAKHYSLMLGKKNPLFLLPALLALTGYDDLHFRDMLKEHIDGNFSCALWSRGFFRIVTTKPLTMGRFEDKLVVTDHQHIVLDNATEILPYTMHYFDRIRPWHVPSKKPLYPVTSDLEVRRALKHAKSYNKEDIGFLASMDFTPKALDRYTVISSNRMTDNLMSTGAVAFDYATYHGFDAVVFTASLVDKLTLRHLTNAHRRDGNLKRFNFLDYETHVLP